ncbi:MAG: GNAT family N-acetyltransferase [Chitinophagaceae bacterium]|nr:MAG: GNAT family N-acetyltransferase [Chitinophagaceae bacterium]
MADQLDIRRASPADASDLSFLILENAEQVLRPHYNKEQWQVFAAYYSIPAVERKLRRQTVFCGGREGRILGTVGLQGDTLVGFYTRYGYSGQGIGTRLLDHAERFAATTGIDRLHLSSSPEGLPFYRKSGWMEFETKLVYYSGVGFEETRMEKDLVNLGAPGSLLPA